MTESSYTYRTPSSQLVEIAKIAAPFRGQPDRLNHVATEVKRIVPVLSYDVARVIAREIDVYKRQALHCRWKHAYRQQCGDP